MPFHHPGSAEAYRRLVHGNRKVVATVIGRSLKAVEAYCDRPPITPQLRDHRGITNPLDLLLGTLLTVQKDPDGGPHRVQAALTWLAHQLDYTIAPRHLTQQTLFHDPAELSDLFIQLIKLTPKKPKTAQRQRTHIIRTLIANLQRLQENLP